jgi:hypothetical protein
MFIVAAIFLWRLFLYCDIVTLFLQSRKQININSHSTCSVLCVFVWSSLSPITYSEVISEHICLYMFIYEFDTQNNISITEAILKFDL